jgi:hypothetical protein
MAKKRTPTTPDTVVAHRSLRQALGELEDSLAKALTVYENTSAEAGRVLTIEALNTLLEELGIDVRLRQPLISLHGMLVDAERAGAEMPLSEMVDKVRAAVTLDILIGCGIPVADAANRVARVLGDDLSAKVIITYRRNLRGRRARADAVAMFWDMVNEAKAAWACMEPAVRAEEALTSLRQSVVLPAKVQIPPLM